MKRVSFSLIVIFAGILMLDGQLRFTPIHAQDKSANDVKTRNKIAVTDDLAEEKAPNGIIRLDLQHCFQNALLSQPDKNGYVIAACVNNVSEANSLFGDNTETNSTISSDQFQKNGSTSFPASDFSIGDTTNASSATLSGRVLNIEGKPIPRAKMKVMSPAGNIYYVSSNFFGYYRFAEIPAGSVYIVSVTDKRYQFASQVVSIGGDMDGIDFIALP